MSVCILHKLRPQLRYIHDLVESCWKNLPFKTWSTSDIWGFFMSIRLADEDSYQWLVSVCCMLNVWAFNSVEDGMDRDGIVNLVNHSVTFNMLGLEQRTLANMNNKLSPSFPLFIRQIWRIIIFPKNFRNCTETNMNIRHFNEWFQKHLLYIAGQISIWIFHECYMSCASLGHRGKY